MTLGTLVYVDRSERSLSHAGEQGVVIELTTRHRAGSLPERSALVLFRDGARVWIPLEAPTLALRVNA